MVPHVKTILVRNEPITTSFVIKAQHRNIVLTYIEFVDSSRGCRFESCSDQYFLSFAQTLDETNENNLDTPTGNATVCICDQILICFKLMAILLEFESVCWCSLGLISSHMNSTHIRINEIILCLLNN